MQLISHLFLQYFNVIDRIKKEIDLINVKWLKKVTSLRESNNFCFVLSNKAKEINIIDSKWLKK